MRAREQKLIDDGFELISYEYDGDAQRCAARIEARGLQWKLLREKSDTRGLKMFSVWAKGASGIPKYELFPA